MKKSNKIIILTGMILLLAVTAVFNFILTTKANPEDSITTANYFTQFKSERLTTRNEQLLELNATISSAAADAETLAETISYKNLLLLNMEKELLLEQYIIGQGFEDAVVAIGIDSGNINVFVKSDNLTTEDAIKIYSILKSEANAGPENVGIIPIKSTSN